MTPAPSTSAILIDEGNLDELGACLCAIRSLTNHSGMIDVEDARAIYALACIGLAEWRKLDAVDDTAHLTRAR